MPEKNTSVFRGMRLAVLGFPLTFSVVDAQIVTDGSVGPQFTLSGPDIQIGESLGTRTGNNLFHSFQSFNISSGGSVTFTGAPDISNVFSRVTGGEVSIIQGVMRSEVGNADFYFINPAGVTFTESGSIDVPAVFHLSTADELRFEDNVSVNLADADSSTLSMAQPGSFGFLGSAGSIDINGGYVFSPAGVRVATANMISVRNSGLIGSGTDSLMDGGTVLISAGSLLIDGDGSTISSDTNNSNGARGDAGIVDIDVIEDIIIQNGGRVSTSSVDILFDVGFDLDTFVDAANVGDAGEVRISGGQLVISGEGSGIFSDSIAQSSLLNVVDDAVVPGSAGSIEIDVAESITMEDGGQISSSTETEGDAGVVSVTANTVLINDRSDGGTGVFSDVRPGDFSSGNAGRVELLVPGSISIINGGEVSSSTDSDGNAGAVSIEAGSLFIDNEDGFVNRTGVFSSSQPFATGNAGQIEIFSEFTEIRAGGSLSSGSSSFGDGGLVALTTLELLIDGIDGTYPGTGIFTDAFSIGRSGDVVVITEGQTIVQNGAQISSSTRGDGDAGTVVIDTGSLLVAGVADLGVVPTGIFSDAVSDSFGSAGSVALTVHGLAVIQDTGQISTLSSATDAGSVELDVESLVIRNGMITTAVDNISTPGGDIFVDGDVLVLDSGIIQANATSGRGGQIVVVPVVVASRNQFDVGGVSRVAFQLDGPNVIQAVRPEGVLIEAPQADISGSLSTLDAKVSAPAQLADNPCAGLQSGSASSLLLTGRGGLPSQFDETRNLSIESDDDAEVTFNEIVISPPGKSHSANGVEFGYGVECRG